MKSGRLAVLFAEAGKARVVSVTRKKEPAQPYSGWGKNGYLFPLAVFCLCVGVMAFLVGILVPPPFWHAAERDLLPIGDVCAPGAGCALALIKEEGIGLIPPAREV